MINQLLAVQYGNSITTWGNSLVARIKVISSCVPWLRWYLNGIFKTGDFQASAPGWISCSSTTEAVFNRRDIKDDISGLLYRRTITPLECPLVWARDANVFDCVNLSSFLLLKSPPAERSGCSHTFSVTRPAQICVLRVTTRMRSRS